MDITLTPVVLGAVSSVVTEIFKYVPFLNKTPLTRAITAIVVVIVAVFVSGAVSFTDWQSFLVVFSQSLVFALASYKTIVQPVSVSLESKPQVTAGNA